MTGSTIDDQLIAPCGRIAGRTLNCVFTDSRAKTTDSATVLGRNSAIGNSACAVPGMQNKGRCQSPQTMQIRTAAHRQPQRSVSTGSA
jgi:hypothetical protein